MIFNNLKGELFVPTLELLKKRAKHRLLLEKPRLVIEEDATLTISILVESE